MKAELSYKTIVKFENQFRSTLYGVCTMSVLQAVGGQVRSKGLMAAASSRGERGGKGETHSGLDFAYKEAIH